MTQRAGNHDSATPQNETPFDELQRLHPPLIKENRFKKQKTRDTEMYATISTTGAPYNKCSTDQSSAALPEIDKTINDQECTPEDNSERVYSPRLENEDVRDGENEEEQDDKTDEEQLNFMPYYKTRLRERNAQIQNMTQAQSENICEVEEEEEKISSPSTIDLTSLQTQILERREMFNSGNQQADDTDQQEHTTWNPAELAVRQFIAKYNPTSTRAGDEMLKLIRYLTSDQVLQHSKSLPLTLETLYNHDESLKHARKRKLNSLGDNSSSIEAQSKNYQEKHLHLDRLLFIDFDEAQQEGHQISVGVKITTIKMEHGTQNWLVNLPHFNILAVVADLLVSPQLSGPKWEPLFFNPCCHYTADSGERLYSEMTSGDWWKETEDFVRSKNPRLEGLLPILLYIDGVAVDFFSRVKMHPVVLSLGNFNRGQRDSIKGKRLLGFIPELSDTEITLRCPKADNAYIRRQFRQKCLAE